jgi:transposase
MPLPIKKKKRKKNSTAGYKITDVKKLSVLKMLKDNGGNIMRTAKMSGISRPTIIKWIKEPEPDQLKGYKPVPPKPGDIPAPKHVVNVELNNSIEERISELSLVVKYNTLQRIEKLIVKETSIDKLSRLFTALSPKQEAKASGAADTTENNVLLAFQQTTNNNYLADSKEQDNLLKKLTIQILESEKDIKN